MDIEFNYSRARGKFIAYCEGCKENICMYCEQEHKDHKTIYYGKHIPDEVFLLHS